MENTPIDVGILPLHVVGTVCTCITMCRQGYASDLNDDVQYITSNNHMMAKTYKC